MGLLDLFENIIETGITLPIAVIHDTVTLGGALTDREEPMTASVIKKTVKSVEDVIDDD